ncbi:MAG: sulfite exporter TauE/SafE family protein [Actinomycetaceae bacterium]
MELSELALLAVAALGAGAINGAVGSGSLITLPVLLSLGLPPATALMTNTVGILFSGVGGTMAYRTELLAERREIAPLAGSAAVGATLGAVALLVSPPGALQVVVPALIVVAIVLVALQSVISGALARRRERLVADGRRSANGHPYRSPALRASMFGAAIYGGYFTAAQGILYMGILGAFTGRSPAATNGLKNFLGIIVNLMAVILYTGAFFLGHADIVWIASLAIGIGAVVGGYVGADIAKRLPSPVLRGIIIVVALFALARELL